MLALRAGTGGHSLRLVVYKLSKVAVHSGAEAPVAPARLPSAKASESRGPAHGMRCSAIVIDEMKCLGFRT